MSPTMQHRHFELIADIISKLHMHEDISRREIALQFAHALWKTNNTFDHARFVEACSKVTKP